MKKKYFLYLVISLLISCQGNQQIGSEEISTATKSNATFFLDSNPMIVGCYYYPEQWPETEWDRDLKRMSSLGFEFTHYGEFAWSTMEPEEGRFDFDWLDRAIEIAHNYKLKVILCTPTPTPPAWLVQKHPEILMQNDQGITMQHGSRQQGSWSSELYREYVKKIVKELGKRYGQDKRIWGWQLDNEPSHYGQYDYNDGVQKSFRVWLEKKYKDIDSLNNRWGNNFWSQNYTDFSQIRIPNPKELVQPPNPHALLDFQEFSNHERGTFLRLQSNELRKLIRPEQFITTNYFMQVPHIDPWVNKMDLDFASYTNYPVNSYSEVENGPLGFRLGSGRDLAIAHDFYQSVNGLTGIMELQPGQVNWGRYNTQPLPGAVRMWIWHSFALGAKFVCTYRYRQPLYGNEQYHNGIMQTDGITLSRGGEEYTKAIQELNDVKKHYRPTSTEKKVGIWWDQRSMLDMLNFPHNQQWNATTNFYQYYEILKSFGLPVEFLPNSTTPNPENYPALVIPSIQLVDDWTILQWENYVKAGGILIITPRTGQKNRDGHLWKTKLQEKITRLTGASVLYYDHLPPDKIALVSSNKKDYEWNSWGEVLELSENNSNTNILASYTGQFYAGKAAAVCHSLGKGKVVYIGVTTKNGELEKDIFKTTFMNSIFPFKELPRFIYQEKRGNLTITVNYSSMDYELNIMDTQKIILGEKIVKPGEVTIWKE